MSNEINVTPAPKMSTSQTGVEEWRNITDPRVKPQYEVSNFGRVRNKNSGYILKARPTTTGGYRQVGLLKAGQYGTCYQHNIEVHRLVAFAFLPPPEEGQTQVDHIDGNPANNNADNLRWATRLQNAHNPVTERRREASIDGIVSTFRVRIRCEETGEVFPSMHAAAVAFGVSDEAVRQSCNRTVRDPSFKGHKCWACPWHFRRLDTDRERPSEEVQKKEATTPCNQPSARAVRCIETGVVFPSVLAAARAYGLAHKTVWSSCKNTELGVPRHTNYSKKQTLHFEWYKPEESKED